LPITTPPPAPRLLAMLCPQRAAHPFAILGLVFDRRELSVTGCNAARSIHDNMLLFAQWDLFAPRRCVLKQESR